MHIEVFGSEHDSWYWHFRNKGRITADSEAFPTKEHALRAAKGVVKAVCKETYGGDYQPSPPRFTQPVWDSKRIVFVIRWS